MKRLTRQQQLIEMLRIIERPGTPDEARSASARLREHIQDPAMARWLLSVLEAPPPPASTPALRQQINDLIEQNRQRDQEIVRLKRELKTLKADARAFGFDPRLPRPGLRAEAWWAWLHERGVRIFNAGAMSKMVGAPSRSSLLRLSKTLDFKETWRVWGAGCKRPQEWRTTAHGVSFVDVVSVLDIFNVGLSGSRITRPDGVTLCEGVDFIRSA